MGSVTTDYQFSKGSLSAAPAREQFGRSAVQFSEPRTSAWARAGSRCDGDHSHPVLPQRSVAVPCLCHPAGFRSVISVCAQPCPRGAACQDCPRRGGDISIALRPCGSPSPPSPRWKNMFLRQERRNFGLFSPGSSRTK